MLANTLKQNKRLCKGQFTFNQGKRNYIPVLQRDTIRKSILEAEYAVRGAIAIEGENIRKALKLEGHNYDFAAISPLHIGNPQAVGQNVLSFPREVISALMNPQLLDQGVFHEDVANRVREFQAHMTNPVGAYTANAKGFVYAHEKIAEYISRRDGVPADKTKIYMTNGASEGCKLGIQLAVRNNEDGVLLPIPQYPLYSASMALQKGTVLKYYLDEDNNWGLNLEELEAEIRKARKAGINVRAIVVINPGNPTGQVLSEENIADIIKLCHRHSILIMADEVYQDNVYEEDCEFHSFRKVLYQQEAHIANEVELLSFNSISKGVTGECGLRGGYIETHNIDPQVEEIIIKLKSIELCANTIGQLAMTLKVDPPKLGRESAETVENYTQEYNELFNGLKERALMITEKLNKMENITCNSVQGAMYAFPRIHFTDKVIQAAKEQGVQPDFMYCMQMLKETGIQMVPGSGFGQVEGTYHMRLTNLVTPSDRMAETLDNLTKFNTKFIKQYK